MSRTFPWRRSSRGSVVSYTAVEVVEVVVMNGIVTILAEEVVGVYNRY